VVIKGVDWWAPHQISFSWPQVQWLLAHYSTISEGWWPHEDKDGGYTDIGGITQMGRKDKRRRWAYFETPCDIAAELDERMSRIGPLGSVLRDIYIHGWPQERVARWWGISQSRIHYWQRLGMYYMTGRNRKEIP